MQTTDYTYEPESGEEIIAELEEAYGYVPDYGKAYKSFARVFRKFIDQRTENVRANLCGAFAKTDYLLKEYGATKELVMAVNATRTRLRRYGELTEEKQKQYCYIDFWTLKAFVRCVTLHKDLKQDEWKDGFADAGYETAIDPVAPEDSGRGYDSIRMIVSNWDDEYIYGTVEQCSEWGSVRACYGHGNTAYNSDWTYIRELLCEGRQLNIVRPRIENGVLFPELIIVEPDYLVDISTVARCFTNYAESPVVSLLDKLRPSQNSEAIVLGNLAGQLLDEIVTGCGEARPYGDSVCDFFRTHAISLLTAGVSQGLHDEARRQKNNIVNAISRDLPETVARFNVAEGMVEPSFFSEMLGLQGRMDYLQLDFRVLLEQKSGKGDFPYGDFSVPRHREEHYVQMLLYMLLIRYNYRDMYERNNKELHSFLLYSKYSRSLLGLGFAPELVFRAVKVRNSLAYAELAYTKEGAFRSILDAMTPETVNQKNVRNKLWLQYQYMEIAELLAPIRHASALERDYYYRFLTFIANEHVMSKLGNKSKEGSGFASTWNDSLEEKRLAGNIYDNLTMISPDFNTDGRIEKVKLQFKENVEGGMSNFRVGDIVILYPYLQDREPDARKTMVFRCGIEEIQADNILLVLRAPQSDSRVFLKYSGSLWAIEHDFFESSYNSLYRGMHSFLTAPKHRRDLLMLQRKPDIDATLTLKGEYGSFNEMALKVKRAKDLFLIIGPPGTGKTSFGMLNTVKEELLEPGSSVLLLSYTNRAVDEMCSKLCEEGIDFIRVGNALTCAPEYRNRLLVERARGCSNLAELRKLIETMRVYVGTTAAFNANISLLKLREFTLAVIDEASQILEPHLIGLLSAHEGDVPAIKKIVMIGDHKQLPAVVQQGQELSRVKEQALNDIYLSDCRQSLFERLLKKYHNNEEVTYMLRRQGRMHHDIAMFPNMFFYNGLLEEVPLPHQLSALSRKHIKGDVLDDILQTKRFAFVETEAGEGNPTDKVNLVEADLIAKVVKRIYELERGEFLQEETVGVIVPYRNQIAAIRNALAGYGIAELSGITIDTVERFQGSQRKYIVYGFTISRRYQLKFLTDNVFVDSDGTVIDRKLNVAMTRAMEHMVIFGNARLLNKNITFARLIDFAKQRDCYYTQKRLQEVK